MSRPRYLAENGRLNVSRQSDVIVMADAKERRGGMSGNRSHWFDRAGLVLQHKVS